MKRRERWLETAEHVLDSFAARTVLSALILVSVMPPKVLGGDFSLVFLCIFGPEFVVRALLVERRRRARRLRTGEIVLLGLDLLAIATFLPSAWLPFEADLRLLRLARLLLLLGYWRDMMRELWSLLTGRERRYQIALVLILGGIMALAAAVLLIELEASHDYDGDGDVDTRDASFLQILWWSFRQVQDPGNLVPTFDDPLLVAMSLLLTFAGLLLFSFFIGIGTTIVEELVERSRSQPLGLRGHTVVLGLGPYSTILLRELADIYRKNLRPYRAAVLAEAEAPDVLADPALRNFRYRRGDPSRAEDLERVSLQRAKRVIVVADDERDPDATVISSILATRDASPSVPLFPDLEHERNFRAARAAGGPRTHLIGSGSMLGHYVAQNVAFPGIHALYRQLLQSKGCEIYTYIFDDEQLQRLASLDPPPGESTSSEPTLDVVGLHRLALEEHRTTLIGLLTAPDPAIAVDPDDLDIVLNPIPASRTRRGAASYAFDDAGRLRLRCLRGLIGVALRFSDLTELAQSGIGLRREPTRGWLRRLREPRRPAPRPRRESPRRATDDATPREALSREAPSRETLSRETLRGLTLRPPRPTPERVLILGAGPRVPRVVMELIGFFRRLEITVLAAPTDPMVEVAHDMQIMLTRAFSGAPELEEQSATLVRVHLVTDAARDDASSQAPGYDARVTLMTADWTHGHRLEEEGVVTLEGADVILLLPPSAPTSDSDGRIALDCLHLANLERTGAAHFRDGVHVLALMRDPAKGALLEQRLAEMRGGRSTCRYTVVSRELVRNRFIVQSVFVHGLSAIYLQLLSARGQFLARVTPAGPDASSSRRAPSPGESSRSASVDLPTLGEHLLEAHGVLLIGYETRGANGRRHAVVDPEALRAKPIVETSAVAAFYVLGDAAALRSLG